VVDSSDTFAICLESPKRHVRSVKMEERVDGKTIRVVRRKSEKEPQKGASDNHMQATLPTIRKELARN